MEWALSFTGVRGVLSDHFEINKRGAFDEENDTPLARNETGGITTRTSDADAFGCPLNGLTVLLRGFGWAD
jgi:hypothetical protein